MQGESLVDMSYQTFARAVGTTVATQYAVTQAAARRMAAQQSGVILTVTGHGSPYAGMGTTTVQWGLVEAMLRQWAVDLGPAGVRVCWLRTAGFRESILGHRDYGSSWSGDAAAEEVLATVEADTMLGRVPSVAEAGRAAVYQATADGPTAAAVNLTAGSVAD
ncbi:Enoyl-(Acyl carrier protein) reductase [Amycolatopsis arida]|uniref:Enoyl-(Acyl carrier protein) reductase n=1 Tax=Amycolatopsis arida TaxID=587909 RepID=A0A1I5XIV3_9PSEU|nr:SDR family oxidoreductase [Amycolatopsis arida]TDX97427.1 enoyl-ACP reductase-like protein [Amycolatopsis arida]SFQ31736.1 Enoyl-(Acyl carrier protein) reductase [Amycolatopsis arida]